MSPEKEKIFLETLENNKNKILKICWVYAHDIYEQEDLFQEVVFNIWKSFESLKEMSFINTWLYRITLNVCMQFSLRSKKESKNKIELKSIHFSRVSENIEKSQEYPELYLCINRLETAEKNIILLYLDDLPYKEIAQILGISENHVAVKIKRIKEKLFKCIQSYGR
jgi:RNA polymerase sigma-70 factor (ECF subfamily)